MDNFIVSARKYRPMRFTDVVGQEQVSETLKKALSSGKLAQSFLFCGPRGVGKTTCARILAKAINCENPSEEFEPCNECNSCKSFTQNASFNIFELDAASNNSVDDIRVLVDQVRFAPQAGKYKVYIIDEVHMLSPGAFNAFLKTLEEPPSYAIFILATTEKHKIIPTILSRCQIFDFKRIANHDIVKQLQYIADSEQIETEDAALHIIAEKADGGLRDALSLFDKIVSFAGKKVSYQDVINNLNILDYDYYFKITDYFISQDSTSTLNAYNEIMQNGFDGEIFIGGLGEHLRNLLVCKAPETVQLLEKNEDLKQRYLDQAQTIDETFLINALSILNQCDIQYKQAKNKRLHVEIYLLKLCFLGTQIENTLEVLLGEKKKLISLLEQYKIRRESKKVSVPQQIISEKLKEVHKLETNLNNIKSNEQTSNIIQPTLQNSTTTISNNTSVQQGTKPKKILAQKSSFGNLLKDLKEETIEAQKKYEFSQENAIELWKLFIEHIRPKAQNSFINIINNQVPEIKGNTISLYVSNNINYEIIQIYCSDIVSFFISNTNNNRIELDIIVQKNEQDDNAPKKKPVDKLKELIDKNDKIVYLIEKLSIDLEAF